MSVFVDASNKISPSYGKTVYSKNKQNVIYLIFDGFGPRIARYFLTNNSMPNELVDWSDDFTFYENVTSLSTAYTYLSLPNMYMGFERSPQYIFNELYKGIEYISKLVPKLKEEGIYDNTKIIIASDHGLHPISYWTNLIPFIEKVNYITDIYMSTNVNKIQTKGTYLEIFNLVYASLPSLLMVKDINTTNSKMTVDDRFLALADIRGIVESTFSLTNIADYTKTNPPKRVFNIPIISPSDSHGIYNSDRKNTIKRLEERGFMEFIKLESIYPEYNIIDIFTVPLADMATVPIYEVISNK